MYISEVIRKGPVWQGKPAKIGFLWFAINRERSPSQPFSLTFPTKNKIHWTFGKVALMTCRPQSEKPKQLQSWLPPKAHAVHLCLCLYGFSHQESCFPLLLYPITCTRHLQHCQFYCWPRLLVIKVCCFPCRFHIPRWQFLCLLKALD